MFRTLAIAAAATLGASPAFAHVDPVAHGSFAAGFTHPPSGADHVLAMLAVGLLAAAAGGAARWALPLAFVAAMAAGFALALAGVGLPLVEPAILGSVIVLGALVALARPVPLAAMAAMAAAFGLFHGHAHGAEMGAASAWGYLAGFALATALLHGAGLALGLGLGRAQVALRGLGGLTAAAGVALAVAA